MESVVKLEEIAVHMDLEPAEETAISPNTIAPCGQVVNKKQSRSEQKKQELGVFQAQARGKTIPLLKTMLTTACERDCYYCPFRAGRSATRRVTFTPTEMADAFMTMYRAGLVEGLFLSSGIIGGGMRTQDKLLDTAAMLRRRHGFRGYIHLKIMPGAEKDQVIEAMSLADRLSVNLEAPNDKRLAAIAPKKTFVEELVRPLQWIEAFRRNNPQQRHPSTTTQFVVGVGETDLELLDTADYLHKRLRLARTYYSAFRPVPDTPLDHLPAENPLRQHRLYQASFLFRDYGFDPEDMPFNEKGNLPLDTDPKQAWAQVHLWENPVEVNRADREELLRVPGIGPKSATAILQARRRGTISELYHLRQIGVETKRPSPYVLLNGKRPLRQLRLL